QRTLTQLHARRCEHVARAALHCEIVPTREYVDRVHVHEAAVVVADVDDDAILRVVLLVEVEDQLIERTLRHRRDVHVTESTAADPLHVRAAALDPVAIDELPLCAGGRGHDLDVTRSRATRTHTQHYLPAGSIREL